MSKRKNVKTVFSALILAVGVPLVLLFGITVFHNRQYAFISLAVAVLSCVPVWIGFERREQTAYRLILLAVLTALSVVGRFLFAMVPCFKPVTAMTVITALYFGPEAGFLTGSLTAVISNFYFGQGAWTPFQMFAWGMIGFVAGLLAAPLKKSRWLLYGFGVLAGVAYSAVMDIFTTLWQDNAFHLLRYGAVMLSSLQMTVLYAVSNVVFLAVLAKPIGQKLERVQTKYGIR